MGFIVPRSIKQHLKVRHNNAWAHDAEKKRNLLSCERLQIAEHTAIAWSFPAGKEPSFRILQLFQKEIKHWKARAPNKLRRERTTIRCCPELYFHFYSSSHLPEAHTEALYLWVLYVTVQSNPFPQGQFHTGSESFIFSCCHTCLNDDVSCTGIWQSYISPQEIQALY